jgi:hypothetical protein
MIAPRIVPILLAALALPATAQVTAHVRFVSREANFSIAAPAGWTWSASSQSQTWSAIGPRGDRFTVRSETRPATQRVPDVWLRVMLPAIARDATSHGERIEHVMHASASAPVFPSIRYAYTRVGTDGRRTFVDGYLAAPGPVYTIQYTSVSREFLPEFWSFVRSFQIVDKFASQRTARASQASITPVAINKGASDVLGRPLGPNQTGCGQCAQ